jgi:hypothetical protein
MKCVKYISFKAFFLPQESFLVSTLTDMLVIFNMAGACRVYFMPTVAVFFTLSKCQPLSFDFFQAVVIKYGISMGFIAYEILLRVITHYEQFWP